MSNTLFQDFNERSREVDRYFLFLKNLDQNIIKLNMRDQQGNIKIRDLDEDLVKTLKASGFLLLYNLIESTMREAIQSIFDELQNQNISYDQIRPELKKIVLKNFRNRKQKVDDILSSITTISIDIIHTGFDRENLFSGNLDGRKIKETANEYGFSHRTDHAKTGSGTDLLTVKTNRNDLAHGFKSFEEVGGDKSTDELLIIKKKVIRYLKQILKNIEKYLHDKEYLERPI
jgi:hypothetical protein